MALDCVFWVFVYLAFAKLKNFNFTSKLRVEKSTPNNFDRLANRLFLSNQRENNWYNVSIHPILLPTAPCEKQKSQNITNFERYIHYTRGWLDAFFFDKQIIIKMKNRESGDLTLSIRNLIRELRRFYFSARLCLTIAYIFTQHRVRHDHPTPGHSTKSPNTGYKSFACRYFPHTIKHMKRWTN